VGLDPLLTELNITIEKLEQAVGMSQRAVLEGAGITGVAHTPFLRNAAYLPTANPRAGSEAVAYNHYNLNGVPSSYGAEKSAWGVPLRGNQIRVVGLRETEAGAAGIKQDIINLGMDIAEFSVRKDGRTGQIMEVKVEFCAGKKVVSSLKLLLKPDLLAPRHCAGQGGKTEVLLPLVIPDLELEMTAEDIKACHYVSLTGVEGLSEAALKGILIGRERKVRGTGEQHVEYFSIVKSSRGEAEGDERKSGTHWDQAHVTLVDEKSKEAFERLVAGGILADAGYSAAKTAEKPQEKAIFGLREITASLPPALRTAYGVQDARAIGECAEALVQKLEEMGPLAVQRANSAATVWAGGKLAIVSFVDTGKAFIRAVVEKDDDFAKLYVTEEERKLTEAGHGRAAAPRFAKQMFQRVLAANLSFVFRASNRAMDLWRATARDAAGGAGVKRAVWQTGEEHNGMLKKMATESSKHQDQLLQRLTNLEGVLTNGGQINLGEFVQRTAAEASKTREQMRDMLVANSTSLATTHSTMIEGMRMTHANQAQHTQMLTAQRDAMGALAQSQKALGGVISAMKTPAPTEMAMAVPTNAGGFHNVQSPFGMGGIWNVGPNGGAANRG